MSDTVDSSRHSLRHRVATGEPVRLDKLSTRGRDFHDDRKQADAELHVLREDLPDCSAGCMQRANGSC